jgi:hypothetical protein
MGRRERRGWDVGLVNTKVDVVAGVTCGLPERCQWCKSVSHASERLLSAGHNVPRVGRLECLIDFCFEES